MKIENLLHQAQDWEKKAMLALQTGQEDLAREAVVRKTDAETEAMRLKVDWDQQIHLVTQLQESLKGAQQKAEKAKREYTNLLARYQTAKPARYEQTTFRCWFAFLPTFDLDV